MMRRNLKAGLCDCFDCGNGNYWGRAAEKAQWRREEGIMRTLTRPIELPEPPAPGDWDLDVSDHVGEDE